MLEVMLSSHNQNFCPTEQPYVNCLKFAGVMEEVMLEVMLLRHNQNFRPIEQPYDICLRFAGVMEEIMLLGY